MSSSLPQNPELPPKPEAVGQSAEQKPLSSPVSKDARESKRGSSPEPSSSRGVVRPMASPAPSRFRDSGSHRDRPYNPPRHKDSYGGPRRGDDRRDYDYDRRPLRSWELDRDRDRSRYGGRYPHDWRRDRSPPRSSGHRRYGGPYSPPRGRSRTRSRTPPRRSRSPYSRRGHSRSPPRRVDFGRRPKSRSPPYRRRSRTPPPRNRSPYHQKRRRSRTRSPYRRSPSPLKSPRQGPASRVNSRPQTPRPTEKSRLPDREATHSTDGGRAVNLHPEKVGTNTDTRMQVEYPYVKAEAAEDSVMRDGLQDPTPVSDVKMEEPTSSVAKKEEPPSPMKIEPTALQSSSGPPTKIPSAQPPLQPGAEPFPIPNKPLTPRPSSSNPPIDESNVGIPFVKREQSPAISLPSRPPLPDVKPHYSPLPTPTPKEEDSSSYAHPHSHSYHHHHPLPSAQQDHKLESTPRSPDFRTGDSYLSSTAPRTLPRPQGTKGGRGGHTYHLNHPLRSKDPVTDLEDLLRDLKPNYELRTELIGESDKHSHREKEYYVATRDAYPALWELELAMIDLQAAEARRRVTSSQLEKAELGELGIDYNGSTTAAAASSSSTPTSL